MILKSQNMQNSNSSVNLPQLLANDFRKNALNFPAQYCNVNQNTSFK
jgi:hypothetical protein